MITVKNLEWRKGRAETPFGPYHVIEETNDDEPFWFVMFNGKAAARCGTHDDEESAIFAAQADYSARILSALEPSAARELALERISKILRGDVETDTIVTAVNRLNAAIDIALRALSSPDHADAGKVEGDGRADLERFWRPISEADKSITFEHTFDLGDGEKMTIRNSDHYWVRDADGRVYEATWSDHKAGYWWDLEGESPVDPVEYMPHPLSLPSAPASEGAE